MRVAFLGCQRSEGGLFIDMNTFLAFGKDCVAWNYEKTGNPVYLHFKQTKKVAPEDRPLKKPTLLAIGIWMMVVYACSMIDPHGILQNIFLLTSPFS